MKNALWVIFITSLIIASCKAKTFTYPENPGVKIQIAEGGGIAGSLVQKTLFSNGQTFIQHGFNEKDQTELKSIKKREAKELNNALSKMNFRAITYNKSGNLYRYIKIVDGEKSHIVQWAVGDSKVPKGVSAFYTRLDKLIKE